MPRSHFSRLPPRTTLRWITGVTTPLHYPTPWQPPQLTPKVGQTIRGRVSNRATPFKNTVRAYNPTKKATPLTWFEGGFFKVVGILLVVALVVPHWIAPPGRRHWVAGAAATTSGGRAMAISACLCECGCVCGWRTGTAYDANNQPGTDLFQRPWQTGRLSVQDL